MWTVFFWPFTHIPYSSFATLTKLASKVNIVSTHLESKTSLTLWSCHHLRSEWKSNDCIWNTFWLRKERCWRQYLLTDTSSPLLFLQHSLWQTLKDIHMYITKHWDNAALLFKFITMCISFTEGGYLRWSVQDGVEQGVCVYVCV